MRSCDLTLVSVLHELDVRSHISNLGNIGHYGVLHIGEGTGVESALEHHFDRIGLVSFCNPAIFLHQKKEAIS